MSQETGHFEQQVARTTASSPSPLCLALAIETGIAHFDCDALESAHVGVEISEAASLPIWQGEGRVL